MTFFWIKILWIFYKRDNCKLHMKPFNDAKCGYQPWECYIKNQFIYIYVDIHSNMICKLLCMRKARNGNCSRSHFLEKTQKRLSHYKSTTAEGIQEKGRSNNASLNYGHLNYSHLPRAHNKRTINLRARYT